MLTSPAVPAMRLAFCHLARLAVAASIAAFVLVVAAAPGHAQVGGTTDILTGTVTGPGGTPVHTYLPSDPTVVSTGQVEVLVKELVILNHAAVLPFPVDDPEVANKVNEELRLQYRYLDLRRGPLHRALRMRLRVHREHHGSFAENR